MSMWSDRIKDIQEHERDVNVAMIATNNHYAGFGPGTSNIFREMLGLERVTWGEEK
jgi:hypothetical protein